MTDKLIQIILAGQSILMAKFKLQIVVLIAMIFCLTSQVQYQRVHSRADHTGTVVTASVFLDKQRIITGSDVQVKIISLTDFTVLHTITYTAGSWVMNAGLHPTDNRIFVLCFDGNIYIYHQTSYTLIHTILYAGLSANYIVFDIANNKLIAGGSENSGNPRLHFYDLTSYAHLSSITTGIPVGDQVNTLSTNVQVTHIAVSNIDSSGTNGVLQFYNLNTNTLISSFSFGTSIKWAIYDNSGSYMCTTFSNQDVKCYRYDSTNNVYVLDKSWNVAALSLGFPYCMNFGITNQLILTIGPKIVFFDMLASPNPVSLFNYSDAQDIFVLDSSIDMQYLVTGGRNGFVGIWKRIPPNNPQNEEQTPTQTNNTALIIGLAVGIPAFLIILAIIVYCCFFGACKRLRDKNSKHSVSIHSFEQRNNKLQFKQRPRQIQDKFIIIKGDQDIDRISQRDYDELMGEGTIIIIKDEEKKRKYMRKLKKKKNKQKKINDHIQQKSQDSSISSLSKDDKMDVEGYIIIIRDDEHAIKKKGQINKNINFDQLMVDGSIIIIRDEDQKKKMLKRLRQNKENGLNQKQYEQFQMEDTIIVIKDTEQQKKYIKQLKKQTDLKNIQHDQILANGDIIVIKDQEKKRVFLNEMKNELKKNNGQNIDFTGLEVADQIIVIRGDDNDQTEQMTYEQLMAEGTVIIIRDQQIKNQYIKYKKQNKDLNTVQNYRMMMAEECIIVIREDDDKQDYVNFMKSRKNDMEKSSQISYNELMNGNVTIIGQQRPKNKKINSEQKLNKNTIKIEPNYQQIMAQGNVVVIQDKNEENPKQIMVQGNIVLSNNEVNGNNTPNLLNIKSISEPKISRS